MLTLKQRFLEWLTPNGIAFFKGLLKEHNTILAVWMEGDIPHAVHFREGMQVRNWMRSQPEFADNLDDHWLDDNWAEFVSSCLKDIE